MERTITILLGVLLAAVIAAAGLLTYLNPMNARRAALSGQLAKIVPVEVKFERRELDVESVQKKIAAKPKLWEQLLEPPAPAPPPPPAPPSVEEMAKNLSFSRQQIGAKIKVMKGGDTKGEFVTKGDLVNGLTIKDISKTSVVLSLTWQGTELTVTKERK